jgi:hypothetical protein
LIARSCPIGGQLVVNQFLENFRRLAPDAEHENFFAVKPGIHDKIEGALEFRM